VYRVVRFLGVVSQVFDCPTGRGAWIYGGPFGRYDVVPFVQWVRSMCVGLCFLVFFRFDSGGRARRLGAFRIDPVGIDVHVGGLASVFVWARILVWQFVVVAVI